MSSPTSPTSPSSQRRSVSFARGDHSSSQTGGSRTEEWTEEQEAELTELKAKLKAAHKSWSAEQELYHDRHDHLEDLKRKAKRAGKKAAKLARKNSDEGKESTTKFGNLFRKVSDTIINRGSSTTGFRPRANSESNLGSLAPLARTRTSLNLTSKLRSFSIQDRSEGGEK